MLDNVTFFQCVNCVDRSDLPITILDANKRQISVDSPPGRVMYSLCTTEEQITSVLEREANFNITDPTKKVFGGSAESSVSRTIRTSRLNTTIMVMAERVVRSRAITLPASMVPVRLPLSPSDQRFVRRYGDSYVSTIERGAWFLGYYNFYSETYDEQNDVLSHFGVNTPIGKWVNIEAGFNERIQTIINRRNVRRFEDMRMAGTRDLLAYPKMENAVEFALQFPKQPFESLGGDSLAVVRFEVTGYEKIMDGFARTARNRDRMLRLQQRRSALESIEDQIQNINVVREAYRAYARPSLGADLKLEAANKEVLTDINEIDRALASYKVDPGGSLPKVETKFLDTNNPVPFLNFHIDVGPILGTKPGGRSVEYFQKNVRFARRLGKISWKLHRGDGYQRFGLWIVEYLEIDWKTGGDNVLTFSFGKRPTDDLNPPEVSFSAGESITEYSGETHWSGQALRGFEIKTSNGRSIRPFMTGDGTPFRWVCPDDHFLFEVFIPPGDDIDTVQAASLKILPASWGPLQPEHHTVFTNLVADQAEAQDA